MRVADFDFHLPPDLIAQHPCPTRDQSRLLVLQRQPQARLDARFHRIGEWLRPGDLLVFNDSKVIPARLRGHKPGSGGAIEILLLEECAPRQWRAMLRPSKRVREGSTIVLGPDHAPLPATLLRKESDGTVVMEFHGDPLAFAASHGEMPLPPYIRREPGATHAGDQDRYQTVYAREAGSVAAPTAGLHFTRELMETLRADGIQMAWLTLHVGAGTFLPIKSESIEDHRMHEERFTLPPDTARAINQAKAEGRRVIAVGTTTTRVLESVARGHDPGNDLWGTRPDHEVPPSFQPLPDVAHGRTRIFIHPPARFRVLDGLVTNFHLPQSTLLMLVSAFMAPGEPDAGRVILMEAYRHAVQERFRFFSYGDAMLIT
ncbi:MAG: tRNA preQ1(34) S-adenosylmethionine ribosyltransferase-isomerase QueA [Verrucomicrobiota bacterium]|jgi:S-adenosylmethionine:tRNA ribosyltransferase-isomerase